MFVGSSGGPSSSGLSASQHVEDLVAKTVSGSPSCALLPFLGKGSPTKIDYRKKKRYPYSNLSAGGLRSDLPPLLVGAVRAGAIATGCYVSEDMLQYLGGPSHPLSFLAF